MDNPIFNVLIVGAGAIGAFYDDPESENILTHAHAFSVHPGFRLAGFVDGDLKRAREAAGVWGGGAYGSIEEAFAETSIDVVCVAVPDGLHYSILKKVSARPLKAVFTEKPLTETLDQADELAAIFGKRKIPVCVNYRRCFVPEFEALKKRISEGTFGKYLAGNGYYGKGFLHNGSHLINLLRYLLGDSRGHRVIAGEIDFTAADPALSAIIEYADSRFFSMLHVNCGHYTVFEIDLLFEKGRVRIIDTGFGIEYQTPRENALFKGYRFLTVSEKTESTLGRSLYYSADNIFNHLINGAVLKCSLHDAHETMKVCERMIEDARASGF